MPRVYKKKKSPSALARRLFRLADIDEKSNRDIDLAITVIGRRALVGVDCAPTDLDAVGRKFGVESIRGEEFLHDGELVRDRDGLHVLFNKETSKVRQRFTIAHELGHAIFESSGPRCPKHGRELEVLCDRLAAELLMPRDLFKASVPIYPSLDTIFELAKKFGTSLTATAIRCKQLEVISSFVSTDKKVILTTGEVKKRHLEDSEIDDAIRHIISTSQGKMEIYFSNHHHTGLWLLEGKRIGGTQKALFTISPIFRNHHQLERVG